MTEYELYYKIMKYFREFMSINRDSLDLSTESYNFTLRGGSIFVMVKDNISFTSNLIIASRLTPKVWYNENQHSFEFIDDTKFRVISNEIYTISESDIEDPDLLFQYNTLIPNFIEIYMIYQLAKEQKFIVDMSHLDNMRILSELLRTFKIEKIGS